MSIGKVTLTCSDPAGVCGSPLCSTCNPNRGASSVPCTAIDAVVAELTKARTKFGPFASAHEGYAVLLEELDELWDEVKMRPDAVSKERMRRESIQIAAMAIRFAEDVCK